MERLLDDLAAALVDPDLALDLRRDPVGDELEGVHVLQLGLRAVALLPGLAHGDVGVAAERALLHLGVGDAELDDRLAQELEEAARLLARADVRLGDDLHERRAAAVEVDERGLGSVDAPGRAADVDGLGGVLLEVRADDPDLTVAVRPRHDEPAARGERDVVLGDLVPLRQVGVEVVLPVEERTLGDLAAEGEAELDRPLDRRPVRHRQRPRMREADGAGARVRLLAPDVLAAAEHLRPRLQLDVDLEADDRFPGHDSRPGRSRSRSPARARGRRGRACSPRTAGRSAAGRPAGPPRGRTGSRAPAGRPCSTGS